MTLRRRASGLGGLRAWLAPALSAWLALSGGDHPARAEQADEVSVAQLRVEVRSKLVGTGNQAVRELRHEAAMDAWSLAYAMSPDPTMLLNLAEACRSRGLFREAYVLLQRFLQEEPGTARKAEVDEQSRQLLAKLGGAARVRALTVAQEHVQPGVTAFGKPDLALATREFALAYALSPTPDLLYNLATCQRKMNAAAEAVVLYEQFLQSGTPSTGAQRTNAESYRSQLLAQIQQQRQAARPPTPPPAPDPPPVAPVPQPPPAPPPAPPPVADVPRRPRALPYLDFVIGPVSGSRFLRSSGDESGQCQFLIDPQTNRYAAGPCPELTLPATPGLQVGISLLPFAGKSSMWVQGLGLEADFELWPAYGICGNSDANGNCTGGDLSGSRVRVAAGLRWDVSPWQQRGKATFGLYVRYGMDRQDLSGAEEQASTRNLPNVTYHYVDAGFSLSAPLLLRERFALRTGLRAGYVAPFGYGELTEPPAAEPQRSRFGLIGSGHGVRVHATVLEVLPWRGLVLQLTCTYQLVAVRTGSIAGDAGFPLFLVGRMDDHRLSAGFNIGYRY